MGSSDTNSDGGEDLLFENPNHQHEEPEESDSGSEDERETHDDNSLS